MNRSHLFMTTILNKSKILFAKLNQREKILLTIVMWTVVIVWLSNTFSNMGVLKDEWSVIGEDLRVQQDKLNEAPIIKQEFDAYWEKMKPEQTFTQSELAQKIDNIARQHNLTYTARKAKSVEDGLLDLHTITVTIPNATIEKLIAFDSLLRDESPYMALQYVRISANLKAPYLRADFRIRSFERR